MEYLLVTAVLLLVYTFIGYPVFLFLISKIYTSPRKFSRSEFVPTVEVILIVRNVELIIEKKIQSLFELDYPKDKFKILIVSDASEDETAQRIKAINNKNIRCIENQSKSTKSACLNQAIEKSEAEVLLLTDARQTHAPASLRLLIQYFSDPDVGAVSGELVLLDPGTNNFSEGMDAYWRYEKFIRSHESKISSVPGVTGAIYAMRREYFQPIPKDTLLDDVLIPMNLIFQGKKVLFESKALAYDVPSADINREKSRKTRTLAGNWQLLALSPGLLNPFKNKIWLQFVSHKLLRLICPFLLLIIFLTSIFLAFNSVLYSLIFGLQILGYSLVIIANFNEKLLSYRIVKIAHSFLILMWFTFLGFWSFVTKQHLSLWK